MHLWLPECRILRMSTIPIPSTSVLQVILDWSKDRPLWLRDALRRVIQQRTVTEADRCEMVRFCKIEHGLAERTDTPAVPLATGHLPSSPQAGEAVTLVSISEPHSVNLLASDQTLAFGPAGLTVIYGDNGSGKSGYSRILKRACRARSRGEPIQPNIYEPVSQTTASAQLTYKVGSQVRSLQWQDKTDAVLTELSAVSVFDSDCATVQVENKNEVAFRPFGLDVPDKLATICQKLKSILQEEKRGVEVARAAVFQKPTWSATSSAGRALSVLRYNTNYDSLVALSALSDKETQRLSQLREDLAKNPAAAAKEVRLRSARFRTLDNYIQAAAEAISDHTLSNLAVLVADAEAKAKVAKVAAEKLFAGEPLPGVGGDIWQQLWESARAYSDHLAYVGQAFPVVGDDAHCVLCQQTLGHDASDRLRRFEEFVKADTKQKAHESAVVAQEALLKLVDAQLGERADQTKELIDEVGLQEPQLAADIRVFLNVADDRREIFNASHAQKVPASYPALPPCPHQPLEALIQVAEVRVAELEGAAATSDRKTLDGEFQELKDRELLGSLLPAITEEIERLKKARTLDQCIADTSTTAITNLGNQLAEQVLTPHLRDRFADELIELAGNRVRVELVYAGGRYGSPQYQVSLIAKPGANVARVLSEGEHKCVALAGFLTELTTASHCSALVFDDPVSSLDHRWRSSVAQRLVKEAVRRQTIVFTHDLVFVHDLIDRAKERNVVCQLRSLRRDAQTTGLVVEGLPWVGMRIPQRLNELEKKARALQPVFDSGDDDSYTKEAKQVYGDMRDAWERSLEEVAFCRVIVRHRDYINMKDLKKVSLFTEQDCETIKSAS